MPHEYTQFYVTFKKLPSWKELEHDIKLKLNLALLTVLHTGQVCCNSLKT